MKKIITILCVLLCFSCNSDEGEISTLTSIAISSSNGNRLDINGVTALSVSGLDQSNQDFTITTAIQWASNNGNASVDQNGNVTAISVGESTITASTESLQSTFDVTIWDSSAPRTEIYVSDVGPQRGPPFQILKYDENGENPEIFTKENLNKPQHILFLEDQEVALISNFGSNTIGRYNANTGAYIDAFSTSISGPTRIKIGPDDLIYALQWTGNGLVKRYQQDGTFVDDFTSVAVSQSIGLDWDKDGNLYVASFNNGASGFVRKFDSDGNDQGLFARTNLAGPTDIWFDNFGNLLVNDWSAGVIARFGANGSFIGNIISGLFNPEGIDYLPSGNMLIGNGGTSSIKMYTSSGVFIKDLVPSKSGKLETPNGVTVRQVN
jgi:hypothetical protein